MSIGNDQTAASSLPSPTQARLDNCAGPSVSSAHYISPVRPKQGATWGRFAIVLRIGLAHAVWLACSCYVPVPAHPLPSDRLHRLHDSKDPFEYMAVTPTPISTHVLDRSEKGVQSPVDSLWACQVRSSAETREDPNGRGVVYTTP